MTRDEITNIALECGFQFKELDDGTMGLRPYVYDFAEMVAMLAVQDATRPLLIENEQLKEERNRHGVELRNAIAKAVKAEREACAQLCLKHASVLGVGGVIAEHIRARGAT